MANELKKNKNKKVNQCTNCKDGHHKFMVTSWYIHGGKQKAVASRCVYCLMPMNLEKIEAIEWRQDEGLA